MESNVCLNNRGPYHPVINCMVQISSDKIILILVCLNDKDYMQVPYSDQCFACNNRIAKIYPEAKVLGHHPVIHNILLE